MFNFDDANKKSKEAVDTALRTYSDTARGFQAIAPKLLNIRRSPFRMR